MSIKIKKRYFQNQENGFKRYLNKNKVWVIRADAIGTSSKKIDLTIDNSFSRQIINTSLKLSENFLVYSQSDEINVFITSLTSKEENTYSKVLSLYSQKIYNIFNKNYEDETFFCVKLFTLDEVIQIKKYIDYRKIFARTFYLTHAAIKANIPYIHMSNKEKEYMLREKKLLEDNVFIREGLIFFNNEKHENINKLEISKQGIFNPNEF